MLHEFHRFFDRFLKTFLASQRHKFYMVLSIIFDTFFDIVKMWKNARGLHENTKIEVPAAQEGINKSCRK